MPPFTLAVSDQRNRHYQVTTAFRLVVAGELVEMLEENTLSFRLTGGTGEQKFFTLRVLDHRQEANREVFEWARIVNQALDDIRVVTQANGKAIRLSVVDPASKYYVLHQQLAQHYRDRRGWQEMAQRVQEYMYQPQLLLPHIQHQGWYPLFFHGLYGQHSTETPETGARIFPSLVGGIDLPLALQRTFTAPDAAHPHPRLQVQGQIDQHRFDRRGLVAWLKTLYDAYDLQVQEQVEYEESYHFDAHHFIQRAESLLSFQAGALYQCSIAHTIELIYTADEPKTIRAEWMLSDL